MHGWQENRRPRPLRTPAVFWIAASGYSCCHSHLKMAPKLTRCAGVSGMPMVAGVITTWNTPMGTHSRKPSWHERWDWLGTGRDPTDDIADPSRSWKRWSLVRHRMQRGSELVRFGEGHDGRSLRVNMGGRFNGVASSHAKADEKLSTSSIYTLIFTAASPQITCRSPLSRAVIILQIFGRHP